MENNRGQTTIMELKLFTDLIDALGKVAGGLKAIINLPKVEREAMRKTLDETYRLIDTTLNMVIRPVGQRQRMDTGGAWVPAVGLKGLRE
jgi:hypothetical protein